MNDTPAPAPDGPRSRLPLILALVASGVWAADQATKWLAVAHLTELERVPVLDGVLWLHLIRNPGAAFSLATGTTWIFTLIALGVAVVIIRTHRRIGSPLWALALGLLLGGALGNLTDRLFRRPSFAQGHVIDFLELPHWPIFNLADSAIVSAAALIALQGLRGVNWDGTRTGDAEPATGRGAGHGGTPAPDTGETGAARG